MTLQVDSYLDLARGGLDELAQLPDIKFNISIPQNLTAETLGTLDLWLSALERTDSNVTFRYTISDFEGVGIFIPTPSGHAVHSSASCTMFRLDGPRYWRDYERDDQISRGMLRKSHGRFTDGWFHEAYSNLGNRLER